jgi:hypothetical protein
MRIRVAWVLPLLSMHAAAAPCAQTIDQVRVLLGDATFPLRWQETTMDDGKPLVMTLAEREGGLELSIGKHGQGIWAEGAASICTLEASLEARFTKGKSRIGAAAPWPLRYALRRDARLLLTRLGPARIQVSTFGWHGEFSPQP